MKIVYVTSNKGKYQEAEKILDLPNLQLSHTEMELPELQGSTIEIATHKISTAYSHLKKPCIIDDVSLFCSGLGGLPGPYIRHFLEALGDKGFSELVLKTENPKATVMCTVSFMTPDFDQPLFFEGIVEGKIVLPRGKRLQSRLSWNAIFQPDDSSETFAEISLEKMSTISPRRKALEYVKHYLLQTL